MWSVEKGECRKCGGGKCGVLKKNIYKYIKSLKEKNNVTDPGKAQYS